MAQMQDAQQMAAPGRAETIRKLTNFTGAVLSVGLVVGVGIWGYRLLVRDVSGVPVVRAAVGPARVLPDDPGGALVAHQGLSVNNVAAEGAAAAPSDRLVLAPAPLELNLDDELLAMPVDQVTPLAEAGEPLPAPDEVVQLASIKALAVRLAEGVEPLQDLAPVAAKVETPKVKGGLGRSLRPQLRPVSLVTTAVVATEVETLTKIEAVSIPLSIPPGTRLAQLGAYESAEIAASEWDRLSDRFSTYLEGKERVIQKAQSGGRTFYRLRAMGFADLSDTRRFCSALVSERAECIPVVTR